MSTTVRAATLLDILGVLCTMGGTERGRQELSAFELLTGPMDPESRAIQLRQITRGCVAFCRIDDAGRALAVAGFIPHRRGVARTWMLATDEAWVPHGAELTTSTKDGITAQLTDNYHRVETVCPDWHTKAKAWYPRIGLKQEATLAKYCTDGSDAALFVKLRENT